jgi:hypothetical protein
MIFNEVLCFPPLRPSMSYLRFILHYKCFFGTTLSATFCQINVCHLLLVIAIKSIIEFCTYFHLPSPKSVTDCL